MNDDMEMDFLSLVQDEGFVRLVKESEHPGELLDELIRKNPANRTMICYAFEFVRMNDEQGVKMDPDDHSRILKKLRGRSKYRKGGSHGKFHISGFLKAAVILVIFSVGAFLVYEFSGNSYRKFMNSRMTESDQALIVLSDGSKRVLENNDSYIEYQNKEVIIRNDKVQEEKVINKANDESSLLNQVVVPYGQRHTIRLSDGTIVQLNSGSKLVFPAVFHGRKREVYLTGEGFFDVRKNAEAPFIVKTGYIDVKALGTTFNVSVYDDEKRAVAVLVEGKVRVSQKDKVIDNEEHVLNPGQACFYSVSDRKSVVKDVDVTDYTCWTEGLFQFKDLALVDVVRRVRKYYNTPVQIEGEQFAKTLISGKLVLSDHIEEVMRYLSRTMEGRYSKGQNGIYVLKQ
ncbi:MAG: FecR domain-containing protein [Mangrovibacterium sp.]|nr:FecR domain-containing protein [Mangrovibacterium sp.]